VSAPSEWPQWLTTPHLVAQALNWLRWRTRESALLIVAIGVNSIAIAKDPKLDPEDAISLLELEQDTIAQLLRRLKDQRNAYGSQQRPQR
jgi:hypothetical protein